ncbi:unnamed protein product [Fraxinus pennsylvanica]|uniref:Uncharacterized protein n=1 Tax=Fraxinus pennsylvanica TaxID=56036 RepID=A0AAD1ZVX3_9LAMI|nr:unnamed protein product [Fraxinus pennsylvanica]
MHFQFKEFRVKTQTRIVVRVLGSLKRKGRTQREKTEVTQDEDENSGRKFLTVIPKPKRGRRNSAIMKDKVDNDVDSSDDEDEDRDEEKGDDSRGNEMMVEEENPNWPLDADVGWGTRA